MTLDDKHERQVCAESVIETMNMVSGRDKEREDYWQVLWDHLYIMSDFSLDVDFPFEVTSRSQYESKVRCSFRNEITPRPIYRHYGKIIEAMIEELVKMPEGEERDALAYETAIQMKRSFLLWNKDTVADAKIFTDLFELSEGKIYLDEQICTLPDTKELLTPSPQVSASNSIRVRKNIKLKKKKR